MFDVPYRLAHDVDPATLRPPRTPVGVTVAEIIRSCPLRALFPSSPAVTRRVGTEARIGTALHRTLDRLRKSALSGSPAAAAAVGQAIFEEELSRQKELSNQSWREKRLPWSQARIDGAIAAVIDEARTVAQTSYKPTTTKSGIPPTAPGNVSTEIPVTSTSRVIHGVIDRAERDQITGIKLVDLKSAYRTDLPDRYERQLQLYAAMWYQQFDERPHSGEVFYPLTYQRHVVDLAPTACDMVLQETESLVMKAVNEVGPMANPGEACRVCDFRPWCRPFWHRQAAAAQITGSEQLSLGVQTQVREVLQSGNMRKFLLSVGEGSSVTFQSTEFPHLEAVMPGQTLRILDSKISGLRHAPTLTPTQYTEIFIDA